MTARIPAGRLVKDGIMKVIGLTGGIGSGKSTVSQLLAELGAVTIDADKAGHDALKDAEIKQEVVAAFGPQILGPERNIDRQRLGEIVFGHQESLAKLNQIMHPPMYHMVKAQIEQYREQGVEVVVLEAPLLIEAGWTSLVDEVWVTVAPEASVLQRLEERAGLSEAESLARIRSQMSNDERVKQADEIIDTDCRLDQLKVKVKELWRKLQAGKGE